LKRIIGKSVAECGNLVGVAQSLARTEALALERSNFDLYELQVCHLMTLSISRLCSVDDKMVNEYGTFGGIATGRGDRRSAAFSTTNPK
jgi:hypothetical protein